MGGVGCVGAGAEGFPRLGYGHCGVGPDPARFEGVSSADPADLYPLCACPLAEIVSCARRTASTELCQAAAKVTAPAFGTR
jgi:hypothetical protein